MFECIFVKWVKAVGVEAGGCAVGGPTTVAGISVSQVWSSRFLSMNSGHQMALSLSFQSQGLNYLWPCVHLHLCVCVWEQLQLSCAIFQWKNIMPVTTTSWTTLKLCTPLTRCEMESVCVGCVSVNRNIQFSCPETEKHSRESALSLLAYRSELAFTRNQNIKIKDQSGAQVCLSGLCMCALVKLQECWIPHQLWHTFDLGNVGPSSY